MKGSKSVGFSDSQFCFGIKSLNNATDGNGNAIWDQYNGEVSSIWVNQYNSGSGWSDPRLIEPESSGSATSQKAAIELNGNAIAVWQKRDGNVNNIFANIYSVENDWGIAKLIETKNDKTYSPQVVTGMNGSTMVIWTSRVGSHYQLWAIRYSDNAGWSEATQININ